MDICNRLFNWKTTDIYHTNEEEDKNMEDKHITTETFLNDEGHQPPVVGEPEVDQAASLFAEDKETSQEDVLAGVTPGDDSEWEQEANYEQEADLEEEPLHSAGEAMLVEALIKSLKESHEVAAVYNYILTEAIPVAPGIVGGVIDKIDKLLPAVKNAEEGFLLSLHNVGVESNGNQIKNPFYELKRKYYALKYLLEGHTQ